MKTFGPAFWVVFALCVGFGAWNLAIGEWFNYVCAAADFIAAVSLAVSQWWWSK